MHSVRIGHFYNDSSTKNSRDASRREAREGVHRGDGTLQSRITARIRVPYFFADQYSKSVFVDLLKAKSEALASLKKFFLNVGPH